MNKIKQIIQKWTDHLLHSDHRGLIFLSFFLVAITLFILTETLFLPGKNENIGQKLVGFVEEKISEVTFDNIISKESTISNVEKKTLISKINTLQAKSAYVYDATNNKIYFDLKSDIMMPLASLTKIMTAITVAENLNTNEVIVVDAQMLLNATNSDMTVGERWKVGDLIKFMLITSSNNAANLFGIVAKREGKDLVSIMNKKSKEIGLSNTFFINETGLDETEKTGGSYGTAKDVVILMQYALKNHPQYFEPTANKAYNITSESGVEHHLDNTSQEISSIPGITASKTGLTSLAGGNLAFIFNTERGDEIIVSLLGSTKDGRFSDADILSRYATGALK